MSITAPDGSVWPTGSLRALEHQSIRDFVQRAADDGYLKGRVLDFGCGSAPYREIVQAHGGEWFGYDRAEFPDNHVGDVGLTPGLEGPTHYDAVLATQVCQYELSPFTFPRLWRSVLGRPGFLVLTWATNWPEAQEEDLIRFTKTGMERLLTEAGFTIIHHERRAEFRWHGDTFALGYGVIAQA